MENTQTNVQRYSELLEFVTNSDLAQDFEKFYEKGNKSAGTRIRKAMQELKTLCQDIRLEVQEIKKSSDE